MILNLIDLNTHFKYHADMDSVMTNLQHIDYSQIWFKCAVELCCCCFFLLAVLREVCLLHKD